MLENERVTVGRYRERIRQAEVMGEYALSETLRTIIVQEQEHEIDLKRRPGDQCAPPNKALATQNGRPRAGINRTPGNSPLVCPWGEHPIHAGPTKRGIFLSQGEKQRKTMHCSKKCFQLLTLTLGLALAGGCSIFDTSNRSAKPWDQPLAQDTPGFTSNPERPDNPGDFNR